MKNTITLVVLLMLVSVATVASAQSATPWDGFYLGASLGGENTNVCSSSTLTGMNIDPATSTFARCSSGGLVGGLQFGENFQIKRLVFGIDADLVVSEAKSDASTLQFSGAAPPPGTYSLSGKLSPKDFAIVGGRIGYGGDLLFPYLRAGAVITSSQSSTLAYVPAGTAAPSAFFGGGRNFSSTGWAAGVGAEIGLNGAWSISAEYLHMSLGKGSNSTTTCAGAAAACSAFAGASLDNMHNGFTANIIRIGINYWFNYWDKP
ncbi:MAG TPA: outer membrane beta-barrel protein [Steroidobacteraceae bacterium]|jgi:outer membrane immunogenic protein|nr:outer membrane beta-barrel protein [Steroidobacteraceae bacterium]